MMQSYLVERAIVSYIYDLVEQKKLAPRIRSQRELANIAFPDRGEKLWRDIRLGQNGKPKGLTLDLALQLAKAVGIPLPKLLLIAELMIEGGWSLEKDTMVVGRERKKDTHTSCPENRSVTTT